MVSLTHPQLEMRKNGKSNIRFITCIMYNNIYILYFHCDFNQDTYGTFKGNTMLCSSLCGTCVYSALNV